MDLSFQRGGKGKKTKQTKVFAAEGCLKDSVALCFSSAYTLCLGFGRGLASATPAMA